MASGRNRARKNPVFELTPSRTGVAQLYDLDNVPFARNEIPGDPGSAAMLAELQALAGLIRP